MGVIRFGLKFWKKYLPLSILAKVFSLFAMICSLALPLLDALIIDSVIAYDPAVPLQNGRNPFAFLLSGKFGAPGTWELFGALAAVFCAVFLLRIIFLYLKNVTFQWCGLRLECDLRELTYAKLLRLDSETISHYNIGELLTTMNRDTIVFKELYARMTMNIFDSVCMISLSVAMLTTFDYRLLFLPLAIAPFFLVALIRYLKKSRALFRAIREGYSAINLTVQENVSAVRIVRAFANEDLEMKKFDADNSRIYDLNCAQTKLSAKYNSIFTAFQQVGYVGTVIIAVLLVLGGNLALGALTAATAYVTKIISHITQISRSFHMMQNQIISGGRLRKFLAEEGVVPDCGAALLQSPQPHIRLENVSLTLGEKPVLKNVNLDIPFGKRVGIMGGTGSGKSVLLKSLTRIYDVTSGSITIDGKDIREFSLEQLRAEFSYVFQDVFLFSNTVDANIAFSMPECEEELVRAAAETAQAARFIEKLDLGYETIVGERGVGLSGGQKQRVSVARALVKGAPVLVLDDAASAVDIATEKRLFSALKESSRTMLIAAHRVSAVLDCDEILFLRDGEVIERGTAEELIALNGAFAAVYKLQTADGQLDDSSYGKGEL